MCFSHAQARGALSTRLNKSTIPAKRLVMNHQASKTNNNSISDILPLQRRLPAPPHVPRGLVLLTDLALCLVCPGAYATSRRVLPVGRCAPCGCGSPRRHRRAGCGFSSPGEQQPRQARGTPWLLHWPLRLPACGPARHAFKVCMLTPG